MTLFTASAVLPKWLLLRRLCILILCAAGSWQTTPAADPAPDKTGGRKRAVIAATECVADTDGKRASGAISMRVKDARRLRALLVQRFGFQDSDIVSLVNEQATADAIVSAINRHLIAQSQPGDVAVFAFSGHGTWVQDFDGDEEDGVDEALCPWDHDWKKVESWLTDDVIGNMMDRLRQTNVLVIADACHSGTMTRGIDADSDSGFAPMGVDSGFRPRPRVEAPRNQPPPTPPPAPRVTPPPAPRQSPPPAPEPKREGYLELDPLPFDQAFPRPKANPSPPPQTPGVPNLKTEFTQQDADLLEEVGRVIRERNNQPQTWGPKPKGTLEFEPLFEQKWFPLPKEEFRQRIAPLPNADEVNSALEKLLFERDGITRPVLKNEDWETIKAAEEFMRLKNTYLPQEVEMMGKLATLAKAVITGHPLTQPQGAQVLLAATAADRLGWMSYAEGSHFIAALDPALRATGPDTTFAQIIESITPGIQSKAKEAAQNYRSDDKKPADAPEYQQLPQAEGAAQARITDFMNGFQAAAPAPDSPPPPQPEPIAQSSWQSQSGDIVITLATDKAAYTEGDLVRVSVTTDLDCHLRLFYMSAEHQVYQLFPNQYQQDTTVKKGVTHSFGGEGDAFKLRARPPLGNEILMAVASSRPFMDNESRELQDQLFQEFKNTNLEALGHRGLEVEPGQEHLTGRALHLYRVEAKR